MGDGTDTRTTGPDAGDAAYRPEIDGLRAIAVLAVMLFHAKVPFLHGGFASIDVFFVISGFLITGIIVGSAERGRFALGAFYMRRVRRIVPALVVSSLLTVPFAWMLMIPEDLENYGQSLVATALSANNILLTITSGYFELETQFKPLSHTWSLGVEEQYYAVVPLILLLALRWQGRRGAFLLLLGSSALALALCEYLRFTYPDANYYLLHSRYWQLGLGGMAALAQPRLLAGAGPGLRQALAGLGLAMIAGSLFLLSVDMALPGWPSLAPVLGSCLFLVYARQTLAGRLLSVRPLVGIGVISYSVYLFHEPVFAFIRIARLDPPSPALLVATIPLILLVGWLSWRHVEQPFRDRQRIAGRTVLWFCGSALSAMVAIGLVLHFTAGLRAHSPYLDRDEPVGLRITEQYNRIPFRYQQRPFPAADRTRNVLVLGNSFARDFINMGLETGALAGVDLSYWAVENCQPAPPALLAQMRQAGAVVLASGVLASNIHCARDRMAQARAAGVRHIVVLGTKQFGYNTNAIMLLPESRRYGYRAHPLAYALADNAAARAALPAESYVDLLALLDDGTGTVPVFTPERKLISQDRRHLTRAGARFIGEKVFAQPQFAWLGRAGNQPS